MKQYQKGLILSGLIILLEYSVVPFRTLGFRCNDPNLSYKFNGETIPFSYLMAITITVPLVAIMLVESLGVSSKQTYLSAKKEKSLKQARFWYGQFFFGCVVLLFLIQLAKSVVSEPRPHFFDTCKPDKAVNCTTGYISEYKCTNTDSSDWAVRDSFRSFPSGHSALGIYMAVFMAWFFQVRISAGNYLTVPWFQCLFLSWGLLCCLTRITDRRHHWWDVLSGFLLGLAMAVFTVKVFCRDFECRESKSPKPDKNLNDRGNNISHAWNEKLLSAVANSQPTDDRELREVK